MFWRTVAMKAGSIVALLVVSCLILGTQMVMIILGSALGGWLCNAIGVGDGADRLVRRAVTTAMDHVESAASAIRARCGQDDAATEEETADNG